jgi:hypothetical protein
MTEDSQTIAGSIWLFTAINNKRGHMKGIKVSYLSIGFIAGVLWIVSCGGGGEENNENKGNSEQIGTDISTSISTSGGILELPGLATLEFPAGAFEKNVNVSVQETAVDDRIDQLIKTLPSTPFSGQPYGRIITILLPDQPLKDIVIKYAVPENFLEQLGAQSKPILVANYIQGGDEESLDDFNDMKATLADNVLTAKLPPWVFTNEYPDTNGMFRATVLLGAKTNGALSSPDNSKYFFLKSNNLCAGSLIGSPLEGDLEVVSAFGPRIHPITKKERDHSGTDFRTKGA